MFHPHQVYANTCQAAEPNVQFLHRDTHLLPDSPRSIHPDPWSKYAQAYEGSAQVEVSVGSSPRGQPTRTSSSEPENAGVTPNINPTSPIALDYNSRLANVEFFRRDIVFNKEDALPGYIRYKHWENQSETVRYADNINAVPANVSLVGDQIDRLGIHNARAAKQLRMYNVSNGQQANVLVYPPLKRNTKGSLRLVRLEPIQEAMFRPGGPIKCTLVCAEPWVESLQYECLSYCWGDLTEKEMILVKTSEDSRATYEPFLITRNLHNALRRLRDRHISRWLWVDFISINQSDIHERSHQVGFMKEIYDHATGVTVWLGECESNSQLHSAVSVIRRLWDMFAAKTGCESHHIIGRSGLLLSSEHLETLRKLDLSEILKVSMKTVYDLLAAFFSVPWFRRVWVLQEAFARSSITVRLGEHSLQWSTVIVAALWQSYRTRSYTAKFSNHASGGYLPELWLSLLHSGIPKGLPILELVCRARDFQATDPRDRVFALLGLANDLDSPARYSTFLKPDYNKSKEQVYSEFARALIEQQRNLDVLATVDTFSNPKESSMSASWMPDLDVAIATIRGLGFPRKYDASYRTSVNLDAYRTSADPRLLSLLGYVIVHQPLPYSSVFRFHSNLQLYINNTPHAVQVIWRDLLQRLHWRNSEKEQSFLHAYILTITATGFASPTDFPANPLGNIVPCHQVPSLMADFAAYWSLYDPQFTTFSQSLAHMLLGLVSYGDADQFAVLVGKACHERRFFVTEEGRMGLCPRDTRHTDKIVILYGGSVPYVLRRYSEDEWTFVGECYLEGMMFGEAREKKERDGIRDQLFLIG